ncbi:hypothetical protein BB561_003560 [Smittium simulii]|uniref:Carbohydrate-binding module family 19 domain-containing protein n=1 Tax=Smittium simulii TaxID=133385 RepID=A0A2T9YKM7_9FUNG|nr:hypothetical protein BB561_003560 [Smittium simulii]
MKGFIGFVLFASLGLFSSVKGEEKCPKASITCAAENKMAICQEGKWNTMECGGGFMCRTLITAEPPKDDGATAKTDIKCKPGNERCKDIDTLEVCQMGKYVDVECSDTHVCKELPGDNAECVLKS